MPGATRAPAASRAVKKKHASLVTTGSLGIAGIPCAMVLTAYFVLSLVSRACCHHRFADRSAKLDASVGASGPHDFAVRLMRHSSKAPKRPSHPAANVRDDRDTPL